MDTITHALVGMAVGGMIWAGAATPPLPAAGQAPDPGAAPGPALEPNPAPGYPANGALRRAALLGAICAALPDVDMFLRPLGIEHRAWTHAWLTLALAAPLLALVAWRLLSGRYWRALLLTATALFSHTFLDCLNSFGTQALLPFSSRMVAWDALPIVDPLFSLPPLVAAVALMLAGGGRQRGGRGAGRLATAAVVWCLFYCGWGMWNRDQAVKIAAASEKKDAEIPGNDENRTICRANPQTGTIFVWRCVRRDHAGYFYVVYVDTLRRRTMYHRMDSSPSGPWADQLIGKPPQALQSFLTRAGEMLRVEATPQRVVLTDLRYGLLTRPERPLFQMEVELGPDGTPRAVRRVRPRLDGVGAWDELKATWQVLRGGDMEPRWRADR